MKITNVALIGILLSTSLFAQRDRRMKDQRWRRPWSDGNVCYLEINRKS